MVKSRDPGLNGAEHRLTHQLQGKMHTKPPTPHTCTVDSTSVAPPYLTPLTATDSADGVSPAAAIAGHTTLHSTTMDTKHLQEIQQL